MPTTELIFYAGRVNLMPTQPSLDQKLELFQRALGAAVSFRRAQYEWTFLNVVTLSSDNRTYLTGFLVKLTPESRVEFAQLETRTLQLAIARDLVAAKSRFFVEVETGIIFYHPSMPDIRRDTFESRFCRLFEKGLGNFFIDTQIDPLREQFSMMEELRRFDVILEVDITLRPSNPDHSEYWAELDEKLKRRRAKWLRQKICGSENNGGLDIKDDSEILSGFYMAEDGYGEASVRGRRNGKIRRISSRDAQISQKAPNDDQSSEYVLKVLLESFSEVLRRLL